MKTFYFSIALALSEGLFGCFSKEEITPAPISEVEIMANELVEELQNTEGVIFKQDDKYIKIDILDYYHFTNPEPAIVFRLQPGPNCPLDGFVLYTIDYRRYGSLDKIYYFSDRGFGGDYPEISNEEQENYKNCITAMHDYVVKKEGTVSFPFEQCMKVHPHRKCRE